MTIYIDSDYKCHTVPGEGLRKIETDFFNGKAPAYIGGFRFIQDGETWVRNDGIKFSGMVAPWRDYSLLKEYQQQYEMQENEHLSEIAELIEEVYTMDLEMMGE